MCSVYRRRRYPVAMRSSGKLYFFTLLFCFFHWAPRFGHCVDFRPCLARVSQPLASQVLREFEALPLCAHPPVVRRPLCRVAFASCSPSLPPRPRNRHRLVVFASQSLWSPHLAWSQQSTSMLLRLDASCSCLPASVSIIDTHPGLHSSAPSLRQVTPRSHGMVWLPGCINRPRILAHGLTSGTQHLWPSRSDSGSDPPLGTYNPQAQPSPRQ